MPSVLAAVLVWGGGKSAPVQKGPLTAMQIRLTVVDPTAPPFPVPGSARAGGVQARARTASCDVLVTAPAGTALAAVASALAAAVSGEGAPSASSAAAVVLYAGVERLDTQRCTLGEPPLIDGAVLSLGAPADPEPHPEVDEAPARLHVVAGPDAGGVHLLHGGQVRVGRSADADVPLDDPDVSRLHCTVTLSPEGRVTVADLGSTNGTTLDGARVQDRPVRLAPGALLRVGESALRLAPPGGPGPRAATTPDGEGHVRVPCAGTDPAAGEDPSGGSPGPAAGAAHARAAGGGAGDREGPSGPTGHAYGTVDWNGASEGRGGRTLGAGETHAAPAVVPGQGTAPRIESRRGGAARAGDPARGNPPGAAAPGGVSGAGEGSSATHAGRSGLGSFTGPYDDVRGPHGAPEDAGTPHRPAVSAPDPAAPSGPSSHASSVSPAASPFDDVPEADPRVASRRKGTPLRGTDVPPGVRKRGGLSAWARRLAGGRGDTPDTDTPGTYEEDEPAAQSYPSAAASPAPETWPDPAALLLTALGPGPRLWERGPGHPEALTVRLGTADRPAPDGSGLLPAVPVTTGLREVGALGLAGPRPRLSGLARAVLAQLAALHSPDTLEIVLLSTDRARSEEERVAEWSWLGWLPQLRPGHGQDCRLLLAYDRDQATARADELLRRLEDHLADSAGGPSGASGTGPVQVPAPRGAGRRPSWAVPDETEDGGFPGPYTVVVVDGDPGGADLREAVTRLASAGPRAGIHVVCLAETPAASPSSPVTETYEAACATAPTFRACGAVALLSGDVATALRLLRVAPAGAETERPGPVGPGTVGAVDAVSLAWAERFARALAPLRPDGAGGGGERPTRVSAPLPQSARLLDKLGLARATPASLMARWADAADDAEALGGRAWAVLGAGPRGPVGVDLVAEGPHLLIEGPTGSGRTELLRAVVASLAAAERPDRLGIILLDGRDTVGKGGGGHGDGLRICTDVPHVTTHLTANDPVRMREFAQSLSAELKRRSELLGRSGFVEWHTQRAVSGRIVPQRTPNSASQGAGLGGGSTGGAADIEAPPSTTLRLRPGAAARQRAEATPPLPRLVVVVDDLDALVSPALGSPGRPAAGSVMRALEAVAREGERLGVHLVAAAGPGGRTAESEPARLSTVRITLDPPGSGADEPAPGRGRLKGADGRLTPFQGGRVTGRIPRTATLRPTVVPLEWQRMGDPPARRPVRELGNGPTDLALLASALERAARQLSPASGAPAGGA